MARRTTGTRTAWQSEEDELLISAVEKHGPHSWSTISAILKTRSAGQCSDRWRTQLAPGINKESWRPDEDETILRMGQQLRGQWSRLAALLPGRTRHAVKNRFYALRRRSAGVALMHSGLSLVPPAMDMICAGMKPPAVLPMAHTTHVVAGVAGGACGSGGCGGAHCSWPPVEGWPPAMEMGSHLPGCVAGQPCQLVMQQAHPLSIQHAHQQMAGAPHEDFSAIGALPVGPMCCRPVLGSPGQWSAMCAQPHGCFPGSSQQQQHEQQSRTHLMSHLGPHSSAEQQQQQQQLGTTPLGPLPPRLQHPPHHHQFLMHAGPPAPLGVPPYCPSISPAEVEAYLSQRLDRPFMTAELALAPPPQQQQQQQPHVVTAEVVLPPRSPQQPQQPEQQQQQQPSDRVCPDPHSGKEEQPDTNSNGAPWNGCGGAGATAAGAPEQNGGLDLHGAAEQQHQAQQPQHCAILLDGSGTGSGSHAAAVHDAPLGTQPFAAPPRQQSPSVLSAQPGGRSSSDPPFEMRTAPGGKASHACLPQPVDVPCATSG
jgi:hypothetical protein